MIGTAILNISIVKELGRDISSRHDALLLRRRVSTHVNTHGGVVVLDFIGVRTLCESAADELIALLATIHGTQWFREHVKLINLQVYHRDVIVTAFAERTKRGSPSGEYRVAGAVPQPQH